MQLKYSKKKETYIELNILNNVNKKFTIMKRINKNCTVWKSIKYKDTELIQNQYKYITFSSLNHLFIINALLYRPLEKVMAPHSSTLAWKLPWTEESGRLQSMGSLRIGHDWAISLSLFTFMHWRRKWQPTPEFLPGESQGQRSLVGCRLWGRTESDTTEAT